MSIISILDDPNIMSPANIDASNLWRDNNAAYNEKVKKFAERSHINIPSDFEIPADKAVVGTAIQEEEDDWYFEDDSEDEDQMSYEEEEAEMSEDYDVEETEEK